MAEGSTVQTVASTGVAELHHEPTAFGINAAGWVALSMLVVIGLLLWKNVPGLVARMLDGQIEKIRSQLDEASRLRAEAEMERVGRAQRRDRAGEPGGTAEADLRIEVGGRYADPRGRGGKRALGLADIGAAQDQRGPVADRQRAGERRWLRTGRDVLGIVGGGAAHQRGEAVERGGARRDL